MSDFIADPNELLLTSNLMTRHCLGIAATGGGKSNFLNLILKQQMMRGGGCLHVDGKNSKEAIEEFLSLARQHNRWQDVRIINIDNASLSNSYNPLLRGDADELTTRIMTLIPEAGGDFFRSQAVKGLRAILGVLVKMGLPMNFADLTALMGTETALRWLVQNAPKESEEFLQFKVNFYDQMMETDRRTGAQVMSEKKLQHTFGDLSGRLSNYSMGEAGKVLNSYNPDIDLLDAVKQNQLVYVALPMLSKKEAAIDFAKIMISDLRTAVGQIQNTTPKPSPVFLALLDEFSSYAMPSFDTLFEQARSAQVCLFPFIQTISSLKDKERGLSDDFCNKILGNTWNKISFVLQDPESCEVMSTIAGEQLKEKVSKGSSNTISFAGGDDDASLLRTGGRGSGVTTTTTMDYDAIVRPEDFRNLETGEAIFIGRSDVLKMKVPYVGLKNDGHGLNFPRFNLPQKEGLSLADKYHTFSASEKR